MVDISVFIHFMVSLSIILDLLLIYILLKERDQISEKFTWLAITIITAVILWIFSVEILYILVNNLENDLIGYIIITPISYFLALLAMLLIQIFVKFFVEATLSTLHTIYLVSLFSFIIGLLIAYSIIGLQEDRKLMEQVQIIANIVFIIYTLSIALFIHRDFTILKVEDLSMKQRKQVNSLHYGLLIGLLVQVPIIYVTTFVDILLVLFGCIGITGALFFIIRAYLTDPRLAFILPEKTYLLILANKYGTPIYSKHFLDKDESEETILVSGAIKAITTIMTQFYKVETLPKLLEFEKKLILIKWSDEYFIAVLSEKDSRLLRSAMDRMDKSLFSTYPDITKIESNEHINEIENIVRTNFYFIWK
ncbi:MAG: hypothetical protein ACXAC2_01785 [Candidatus Kariarchaeaceae archaeon]|jgi:hypothetical protein